MRRMRETWSNYSLSAYFQGAGAGQAPALFLSRAGRSSILPSPADLSGALLPSPLSANELIKDLYLYLLNLNKPLPLVLQQVIHLLMQVADLKLSLEVNPVVVL